MRSIETGNPNFTRTAQSSLSKAGSSNFMSQPNGSENSPGGSKFGEDRVTFSEEAQLAQAYEPPNPVLQGLGNFWQGASQNIRATAIGGHSAGNALGQAAGPAAPLVAPLTAAGGAVLGLGVGILTSPILGATAVLEPSVGDNLKNYADSNDPLRGFGGQQNFQPTGSPSNGSQTPYFMNPAHPLY
jgi:hypothetical protein